MLAEQIKTIDRVKDNGEVFTSIYDVKRMCELCKDGLNNIEEIVIEPSCGTGNFLIEILNYKIKYAESISTNKNININIIKAVSTIYGIDIMKDNVIESRKRMLSILKNYDIKILKTIINKNIISADFITGLYNNKVCFFYDWEFKNDRLYQYKYKLKNALFDEEKKIISKYSYKI